MLEYLILDNEGKVVGKSLHEGKNKIKIPVKPFQKDVRWNGEKLIYNFEKPEKQIVTKKSLRETILALQYIIMANSFWLSGEEKREHNGKISVLIPCYKKSNYVITAVKSCLKQTQKPTEIIVLLMDDDSYALEPQLKEMGATCYKEPQMNVCKARTYLAEKCKTDWLIFLDADDILSRNFIKVTDSKEGAFVMATQVFLTKDEIKFDPRDEEVDFIDKTERCAQQNMTALMHKDVFFDTGLNEDYCLGGEDFDFLLKLFENRRWKLNFTNDTYFFYRNEIEGSLTKAEEYFKSFYNVTIAHRDFFLEEIKNTAIKPSEDYTRLFKAKWFLENPSEENLEILACSFALTKTVNNSELGFFEKYIREEFTYWSEKSKQKETDFVFNLHDYTVINGRSLSSYKDELENTCFDCVFLDLDCNDIESLIKDEKKFIIRKDIWEQVKDKYNPIDFVFYMFKNYSCFIKAGTHPPKALNTKDDNFINILKTISFDDTIKQSAKLLFKFFVEGMFTTGLKETVSIAFTLHKTCNADCDYCFQKGKHNQNISDEEMYNNFDKAITYFEKLSDKKNARLDVCLMGGEPTIWSDWLQNKILERLKDYRFFRLYTNGIKKSGPLYESEKCIKIVHLINWQKQINDPLGKNEIPTIVLQESEKKDISLLENYTNTCGHKLSVLIKKTSDPKTFTSYEFIKETTERLRQNKYLDLFILNLFVSNCEAIGLEKTRMFCKQTKGYMSIDCETLQIYPCCNAKKTYNLEDFDLTKKADYEEECCKICNYCYINPTTC